MLADRKAWASAGRLWAHHVPMLAKGPNPAGEPLFPPFLVLECDPPASLAALLPPETTLPKTFSIVGVEPVAAMEEILSNHPARRWTLILDGGVKVGDLRSDALVLHLGSGSDRNSVAFPYGPTGVHGVVGGLDVDGFREGFVDADPDVVALFDRLMAKSVDHAAPMGTSPPTGALDAWSADAVDRVGRRFRVHWMSGYAAVLVAVLFADGKADEHELEWIARWVERSATIPESPSGAVVRGDGALAEYAVQSLQRHAADRGATALFTSVTGAVAAACLVGTPAFADAYAADLDALAVELAALPRSRGLFGSLTAALRGTSESHVLEMLRSAIRVGQSPEAKEAIRASMR
jgi:hypothetical protein